MASAVVSSAIRLLSKALVDEAKHLYSVKGKVEALHDELTWMQVFLQDADTREDRDATIRLWVSQIREFAYTAEDIVEIYLHNVSHRRQDSILNTLKWFSCFCCDLKALHGVGSDIDSLNRKISQLSTRMRIYGVKPKTLGPFAHKNRVSELKRTSPGINEQKIVGLNADKDKLVTELKKPTLKVACISGMGGLGKTTLAKMVNEGLKKEFPHRVWVYVSQQFQTRNILEEILRNLENMNDQISMNIRKLRDDEISKEVYDLLEKKKCLVVLDDIWGKDAWDALAPALTPNSSSESKLLLTTRNTELLSYVDKGGLDHPAEPLTPDESWELLNKIISSQNVASAPNSVTLGSPRSKKEKKVTLGKEMAKQCNGLPLAVVVLGGILATKSSFEEWEIVHENMKSFMETGTTENKLTVAQVLGLSYDDLPYYLKPCFLHLGSFPEDFAIPTKTLYRMWAIEGLVAHTEEAAAEVSLEAVAESYLKELVNRCLVEVESIGKDGRIKSCRLHDLIRDMCQKMSNEESFLRVIEHGDRENKPGDSKSSSLPNGRFHRLVVYMNKSSDSLQELISVKKSHHVRSLLFFPTGQVPRTLTWSEGKISKSLKLVRVLHFDNVYIRSVPDDIGKLIHLRYLSLKGTRVRRLPSSVGKLKYLQILDLRISFCINVMIPNVLWKLERLKHLYLPSNWLIKGDHLSLRGLVELETLQNLMLEHCQVSDLLTLPKLGKVTLADYTVTETESLNSFLEFSESTKGLLKRPLSLRLDGDVINKNPSILLSASKLQFHRLDISGKISFSLRDARIFPQNVKHLNLNESGLEDDPMPILETLTHLTELILGDKAFLGTAMVCAPGKFPQLTELRLVQLPELELWTVGEGAMPSLKRLYIYSCEKLQRVPTGLPSGVKIGCRPCIDGSEDYGNCCYRTRLVSAASSENQDELPSVSS